MPTVEVSESAHEAIGLVARLTGMSTEEVVDRLLEQSRLPSTAPERLAPDSERDESNEVALYVDYVGIRTHAKFDRLTERVTVVDGPLAGRWFKSPTGAARAVVGKHNPSVSPHRNGWSFWRIDDNTQRFVQSIRRSSRS